MGNDVGLELLLPLATGVFDALRDGLADTDAAELREPVTDATAELVP